MPDRDKVTAGLTAGSIANDGNGKPRTQQFDRNRSRSIARHDQHLGAHPDQKVGDRPHPIPDERLAPVAVGRGTRVSDVEKLLRGKKRPDLPQNRETANT